MLNVCRAVFPSGPSQLAAVLSNETSLSQQWAQTIPSVKLWMVEPDANRASNHSQLSHTFPALLKWPGNSSLSFLGSRCQELNRHLIKNPSIPMFLSCYCTCPRSVHIKASRVMWGSKTRCSPGVSLYFMVPQEFSLMRKTKGTDATLQWRKRKEKKNAGDQEVIKAWI